MALNVMQDGSGVECNLCATSNLRIHACLRACVRACMRACIPPQSRLIPISLRRVLPASQRRTQRSKSMLMRKVKRYVTTWVYFKVQLFLFCFCFTFSSILCPYVCFFVDCFVLRIMAAMDVCFDPLKWSSGLCRADGCVEATRSLPVFCIFRLRTFSCAVHSGTVL